MCSKEPSAISAVEIVLRRGHTVGMLRTRGWTPLAIIYLTLSIVGFTITWTFNGLAIAQGSAWFSEWFSNGAATQSLQWDLVVLATAASTFVIVESRRIGMRRAWMLVPLSFVTAVAFTVPLFLALRERHLALGRDASAELSRSDPNSAA